MGALDVSGNAAVTASECGVYVNSSNAKAIEVLGSSSITASQILVNGNCSLGGTSTVSPACTTGSPDVADPFTNLPAPSVSGCAGGTNYSLGNANIATISQGVYCGGITVTGNAQLTLNPGTYILNGSGSQGAAFYVGNSATITGSHVTFFMTGQNGYTLSGGMVLSGDGTATLSAPSSGTYEGVLFYQDRSLTYATANSIGNSATLNATGSLSFPRPA